MNIKLKDNIFYIEGKSCGSFYDIEDFVLNMMILYDEGMEFNSYLHFVKKIKEMTGLGLYYIKSYSDLLRDLGFIIMNNSEDKTIIRNGILNIRSYKDIINMIDYNMSYEQFMRNIKINKLLNKIR